MEEINNGEILRKNKGGRSKNIKSDLVQNLKDKSIPNRKIFDIKEIADIDPWANQIITLKNIETDKNGEKYININGRKYYEFNGKNNEKNSLYICKKNSLFIGDKFEGLNIRDGIIFRYSRGNGEYIEFDQRKAKYAGGVIHIKDIYKSEIFLNSNIVATLYIGGKKIRITKNLIESYLKGELSQPKKRIIETAIKIKPEIITLIEELKNNQETESD